MTYESLPARIAGSRRAEPGLHVDYADVLAQAVVNERERVLRELYREVSGIETSLGYGRRDDTAPSAASVREKVLHRIRSMQS